MWKIFVILLIGPATDSNTLKIFFLFLALVAIGKFC